MPLLSVLRHDHRCKLPKEVSRLPSDRVSTGQVRLRVSFSQEVWEESPCRAYPPDPSPLDRAVLPSDPSDPAQVQDQWGSTTVNLVFPPFDPWLEV